MTSWSWRLLNDRCPHPFINFNTRDPYPLIHQKPEKGMHPFRAETLRIELYREYPLPPYSWACFLPSSSVMTIIGGLLTPKNLLIPCNSIV